MFCICFVSQELRMLIECSEQEVDEFKVSKIIHFIQECEIREHVYNKFCSNVMLHINTKNKTRSRFMSH